MWLLDRMHPAQAVYNMGHVVCLRGPLDVHALSQALQTLVARHGSLRTRFALIDGAPVQIVARELPVQLSAEAVSEAEALERANHDAQTGFDLAQAPLWRVRLYAIAPEHHWLQLVVHHIIADGWSMGVLMREMSQLYAAFAAGAPSPLAELPVQYADYAVWQRHWLQGEALERQLAYWRQTLAGVPLLDLPTDHRRPAVASHRGGRVTFELPSSLLDALKALSRRERATLFMTLLSAFYVLLSRYSGQEDIAVGVPTAGRVRLELEGLIGFFVNTLVVRGDLSGAPPFTTLLARVREQALSAFAHQDVPFEKLVEELAPKRDAARNPLFQVSMVLHNTPPAQWQLPWIVAEQVEEVHGESAKFDLSLMLRERDGRLHGIMEYACDLFEAASVERMAQSFRVLLEGVVAKPSSSIARLPLMSEAQRAQVLVAGMGAKRSVPARCVHELVASQAARTPQAMAVVHGHVRVGYAELEARANQLAHELRGRGVGRDVLVGLFMPRSIDLVIAMLGILKAGGAYVPLDPGYPPARVAMILEDAAAPFLVTSGALAQTLPAHAAQVLCVDRDAQRLAAHPPQAPSIDGRPNDLAYVIYTSGSTGKPKGVMIEHASIVNLAFASHYTTIVSSDVMAHASNIAFDAATFEIWGALLNGAGLAILDADDALTAPALTRAIERDGITCMFLTTSLFNEIARAEPSAFGRLNLLVVGGEAQDPSRVREVLRSTPPRELVNAYGPTETTTFATTYAMRRDDEMTMPIGRPIAGVEVLVLDSEGEPVPPMVTGEVYIAGAGLARTYLARPEETRSRFVPHPLRPNERAFRTGDLARWNARGEIEYRGRTDTQVKIRGFRVEPAEIVAVISAHPQVRAAHVVARRQPSGYAALVAYYVPANGESTLSPATLQKHAAACLPPYMMPAAWIAMDAFPLTAHGKLDESALPQAVIEPVSSVAYAEPANETERTLCRIWQESLGVARVGIDDDFFALGGHSLLAARVFSRMDTELGCALPLGTLFECPTIRKLASRCRSMLRSKRSLIAVTRGDATPIFMVSGVYGNVVTFADLARALGAAQPVYALQAPGLDGEDEIPTSIEDLARHYLAEIRAVQPRGPYAFGGACFGATVAYEMARQVMADGEPVACLALFDPTQRGGTVDTPAYRPPLPVHRVARIGRFAWHRFGLYLGEMDHLRATERVAYVAKKLIVVARRIAHPTAPDLRREISEREVYRGNLAALDRYRRRPLVGDLRLVVLIESERTRHRKERASHDWSRDWRGAIARHVVPGKDSGDMITGRNAHTVAQVLRDHLRAAFAGLTPPTVT